jgi:UDP-glucose:(heptosyl)LPS alpha-1,3-glucosyltransferase
MKIALVLTKFNPARGGLEYWAWEYSRWLVRRGHDVHVLACRFDERIAAEGEIRHTVPDRASRVERADAFAAALDRLGPDVIHDMGAGWRYDILHPQGDSAVAVWHNNFRFLPLPLRVWKRLSRSQRQRYRDIAALERKQYVESDGLIVAVSDLVRRNIATCFGVAPERFVVIPNGADTERFSPQRRVALREQARQAFGVEKKVVCLAVAHNFDLKGVATAVRAIRRLARQGVPVHLLVAGNGPVEKYRRMTTRLGVAASITFLGFLDDSLRAYAAADIFVHPTWQDACSLVAIEAWACGLPVVTTPLNGAAELMTPGCEGLLLRQPGSARELAEHIRTLMDPAVRERMTGPARMLACRHNLAINFAAVEAVYERVLRRRAGGI